jgi:SsrA-binding protein
MGPVWPIRPYRPGGGVPSKIQVSVCATDFRSRANGPERPRAENMSRRGVQLVITNRKARHDYFVLDSYECGIVLKGPEVKSIRNGRANLQDGYARIDDGEVWLFGMHVSPYEFSRGELDPVRPRKLLLHHREIVAIARALEDKGTTLVPLRVYFKDGRAKVEIATARGKARYDKRQAIAKRDALREAQRALKGDRD